MKKLFPIIIGFVFLIACNNPQKKLTYSSNKNDWKHDKLIGKVKTLVQYKANVINPGNGETETPRITFKKEYTKYGMILFQEYYDNFKNLKQKTKNEYNDKGLIIKSTTEFYQPYSRMIQTNRYDTAGNLIFTNIAYNDTLSSSAKFAYNTHKDLVKGTDIQNGDTTVNLFEYRYNKNGKIIWEKKVQNYKSGKDEYLITFKYDKKGNLIEERSKSQLFGEMKWVYKYDNKNKLKESSEYENGQIQNEIYFNNNHNQTLARYYENGKLNREMKFDYKFDKAGNWVIKKAYLKENFLKGKTFKPVYIETRKINYYE